MSSQWVVIGWDIHLLAMASNLEAMASNLY